METPHIVDLKRPHKILVISYPNFLSIYLSTYLSIHLYVHLSIHLSICPSIYPSIYFFIYLSIYQHIYIYIYVYIYIYIYISICLLVYLYISIIYIYLSFYSSSLVHNLSHFSISSVAFFLFLSCSPSLSPSNILSISIVFDKLPRILSLFIHIHVCVYLYYLSPLCLYSPTPCSIFYSSLSYPFHALSDFHSLISFSLTLFNPHIFISLTIIQGSLILFIRFLIFSL